MCVADDAAPLVAERMSDLTEDQMLEIERIKDALTPPQMRIFIHDVLTHGRAVIFRSAGYVDLIDSQTIRKDECGRWEQRINDRPVITFRADELIVIEMVL